MKFTKLSLIAAMLIGSSAFAIENTKVSGNVKLYYGTEDNDNTAGAYSPTNAAAQSSDAQTSLFDSKGAYGDVAVNLELTTDLTKGVSAGVKATYITTLGLENNLVDNTWSNSHGVTANSAASFSGGYQLDDSMYVGEAWIAGTAFDTTLKAGRQALDTPLAFTETWGIDQNTFEAAVLINQSFPDTTLIAAYVGKSNGAAGDVTSALTINTLGAAQAGITSQHGTFNTFGTDGVYVVGAINNSIKPLTIQAWYYNLQQLAEAYWLQADLKMNGVLAGVQYANVDLSNSSTSATDAYAFMLGYEMKDVVTVKAAYSTVDDKGVIGVSNVDTTSGQSKLYTEMWWSYGKVSSVGADSYALTAEGKLSGVDLFAGYYFSNVNPNATQDLDVSEFIVTASKSFGPLDTSLALIYDDIDDKTSATLSDANDARVTTLQVYLTYNF